MLTQWRLRANASRRLRGPCRTSEQILGRYWNPYKLICGPCRRSSAAASTCPSSAITSTRPGQPSPRPCLVGLHKEAGSAFLPTCPNSPYWPPTIGGSFKPLMLASEVRLASVGTASMRLQDGAPFVPCQGAQRVAPPSKGCFSSSYSASRKLLAQEVHRKPSGLSAVPLCIRKGT